MAPLRVIPALFLATLPLHAAVLVDDHFTGPKLEGRDLSPNRGTWKIADGMATCTQDDALYAKNKDHGPVIWYDTAITDGTIRFSIRAEKVKTFVFTLNDEKGHVFRYVLTPANLSVRAWKEQGHEAKADALPIPGGKMPKLTEGEWIPAELKFEGTRCTLTVGKDFKQTFEHPSIAKKKTKLGLGFAYGTLAVRDVSMATP